MEIFDSLLFLLVFLIMVDLSKQGCEDYFTFKQWENETGHKMIKLAQTDNPKDVVECTLHSYCKNSEMMCYVLYDCFGYENKREKCTPPKEESEIVTLHTYHFMCLAKKVFTFPTEVSSFCNYEAISKLLAETTNHRTTPPTTTLQPSSTTTTTFQNTARLQSSSTTTTTAAFQTTTTTAGAGTGIRVKQDPITDDNKCTGLKIFSVLISAIIVVLLLVWLSMHRQYIQKSRSNTPQVYARGDPETHLMQEGYHTDANMKNAVNECEN